MNSLFGAGSMLFHFYSHSSSGVAIEVTIVERGAAAGGPAGLACSCWIFPLFFCCIFCMFSAACGPMGASVVVMFVGVDKFRYRERNRSSFSQAV